jgi:hypothetical protein
VHHRRLVDFTLFFPFCFKLQVLFIAALLSSFFFHSMLGKVFASLFNSWFCSRYVLFSNRYLLRQGIFSFMGKWWRWEEVENLMQSQIKTFMTWQ